jgi:hypothetical protein
VVAPEAEDPVIASVLLTRKEVSRDDLIRSTLVGDFGEWGGRGNDRLYAFKRGRNDFVPGPGNHLVVGAAHASPNFIHLSTPSVRSP